MIRMKKNSSIIVILLVFIMTASSCNSAAETTEEQENTIRVAAASSLQNVMQEVEAVFTKQYPDTEMEVHFGSSGSLKQQIAQGAPVDLFFSASSMKVDQLVEDGHMEKTSTAVIMHNSLVLIEPAESSSSLSQLQDAADPEVKLSIGTPESVPAGRYAKETLQTAELWEDVKADLIQAKNVRQVLTYVENENVDAGFVYKTDALQSSKIHIAAEVSPSSHSPINYPAGLTSAGEEKQAAEELLEFLQSPEMKDIAENYGFKMGEEKQ